MRLLITGGSGQLGAELLRQLQAGGSVLGELPEPFVGAELYCPEANILNICDEASIHAYIEDIRPDAVFHCAAMTNVDGCEDVPELAELVNGTAVKYIARACEGVGTKLVAVSTDYVFSGDKSSPYTVDEPCAPQTAYGRSKRLGEQNALEYCSRTFIVRTSWLYGFHGKNFVKTILRKAEGTDAIQVVADQVGSPTNAEDLAYHLLLLAATEKYGIYHCTGSGICSWHEFAQEIVRLAGLPCRVRACTSDQYPQKAKRPAYSVLDHSSLQAAVGGRMRPWEEALKDYLNKLGEMS